jgi:hypothetical protein
LTASFKNLKINPNNKIPSSGSIEFKLNNWSGTLNFAAGKQPRLKAKDDGKGVIDDSLTTK